MVVSECPPGASKTCIGRVLVLRNRTVAGRALVHRSKGTCIWVCGRECEKKEKQTAVIRQTNSIVFNSYMVRVESAAFKLCRMYSLFEQGT